jgi:hypothetical protein
LDTTYRVVARGLKQGYSPEQAADLLAALFKRSADQVMPLLRGRGIVVKKKLSLAAATKYQSLLDRCGCLSEIEAEAAAANPDPLAPAPLPPEELERLNAQARQIRDTLTEKLGTAAGYDLRAVEWLSISLNSSRKQYVGELGVRVANLYGAFLGNALIETHADAQPVWVKTPEGVGIHFRNPNGRILKIVYPIARVTKQIEHGEEYSIGAFMRAQQQFRAEKPAPEVMPVRSHSYSDGAAPPASIQIDDTADGKPLTIVIPHSICCNCGTSKGIHSITSTLSKKRFDDSELTIIVDLPFCVPCVLTADRVRPHAIVAELISAFDRLMNRNATGQTSRYQPVTLKTLEESAAGIDRIGFQFSNSVYEKEFGRANKLEIDNGRLV